MGISGLRSAAFRPFAVIQESAVYQRPVEHVHPDLVGIVEKLRLLGCVCGDL